MGMRHDVLFIGIVCIVLILGGCVTDNAGEGIGASITPSPPSSSHIVLHQNNSLISGGWNDITISAMATDALGHPVADGTEVNFSINEINWSPEKNGSLSTNDSTQKLQSITVSTRGGWANASYGWIDRKYGDRDNTINAALENDRSINNSTVVRCYFATYITAYVVDTFGDVYGGANVTMHEVGSDGVHDIYTMTTETESGQPYPGLCVFNKIIIYPNATSIYLSSEVSYQQGLKAIGHSNNHSANYLRQNPASWGAIVLRVPPPNAIKIAVSPSIISTGGDSTLVTAQLMLNGSPYSRAGYDIDFSSDNDSVGYLPSMKNNTTDINGRAQILLTSNMSIGEVNITACCFHCPAIINGKFAYSNLTDTAIVRVIK